MGDVLDIKRIKYEVNSNMDHVSEFLLFNDSSHQMDDHARKLLGNIAEDEERDRLPSPGESGYVGCVALQQLSFRAGVSIRETVVFAKLAHLSTKRASLAFVLDLWAMPQGSEPTGLVYTDPILDEHGTPYFLIVKEVQGTRWLYARRHDQQRLWDPELRVIFAL